MAKFGIVLLFLGMVGWIVGLPTVVARCNLRNGLPVTYGLIGSWQFRLANRNFSRSDKMLFAFIAVASLGLVALAVALLSSGRA